MRKFSVNVTVLLTFACKNYLMLNFPTEFAQFGQEFVRATVLNKRDEGHEKKKGFVHMHTHGGRALGRALRWTILFFVTCSEVTYRRALGR